MLKITEGTLEFVFPKTWQAEKFDDTGFYRKHFQGFADSKSVDVVAFSADGDELWLIEVKDYRVNRRDKSLDLFREIAIKVRDTLACLYLARGKPEITLYGFAQQAAAKTKIRVALHLEQPAKPSKLYPPIVERGNAYLKLAQTMRVASHCQATNH